MLLKRLALATIFPVQSALPNPICYRGWSRSRNAPYFGLPLWDKKLLLTSLAFHPKYVNFRENIDHWVQGQKTGLPGAHVELLTSAASMESCNNVIEVLLDNAIQCYGFSACDVFTFLMDPTVPQLQIKEHIIFLDYEMWEGTATFVKLFANPGIAIADPGHSDQVVSHSFVTPEWPKANSVTYESYGILGIWARPLRIP
ncbi:hypothetical protein BDP27DRAFT_1429203 [Rhodocollybia butyracea]|uniref:Uncharacterized protein n=1 Tax=Rhodocollybia butyracea TaxID=206335 RepID=A0A9P5U150_9AGAR|nr:hypothetical protein BDP27DRAFT_1429203 [Rhodocollybia butyracea]